MSDALITWGRAQLDDDERIAKMLTLDDVGAWSVERVGRVVDQHGREIAECTELGRVESEHIALHDPARVLAEVDAKRRILDLHEGDHECSTIRRGVDWDGVPYEEIDNCTWVLDGDCSTVRLLALPYAARPGYREEWRP